ncbi:MAG: DUF1330 domain-containing protein [Gammaproteobacteria bacterium]|jgi:uncharacterized protein (DUF1330 family)|nr:D-fructose-6-phosphate amidotransferase [Chloroflexota bacterium]MBI67869.1 D-fructose-6-phosphate amidotransferase [Chloroflexota bacterium]MCH2531675.1 DUF1330 domain-containing protein [Dehalococcoidia bacterium]MCH2668457.1 DUF1330 domain-containing protein [Gammaproteobacteria bacterium]|tara:strand:+ start:14053 stop:14340 length:288 start_codon:yes stop_codon:yes gene_type:complete
MSAYVVANVSINDPESYKSYSSQVPDTIAMYGGKFLVRGGGSKVLEGEWEPARTVIIEFPDMDSLNNWYYSKEYQAIIGIRETAATSNVFVVEGV